MSSSLAMGGTLRHLRDLFHDGTTLGLGDGQLLARYAATRDEAAFEALVARHGPMVLATCRAVLKDEHDVEDAFQATFLVLARKARSVRAGDALGGWLHRVAYRVSIQAAPSASPAPTRGGGIGDDTAPDRAHRPRARRRRDRARGSQPAAGEAPAAGGPLRPGGADLRAGRRATALDRAGAALPAGEGPTAAPAAAWPAGASRRGARGSSWPAPRPVPARRFPRRWPARRSPRRRAGRFRPPPPPCRRPSSGAWP